MGVMEVDCGWDACSCHREPRQCDNQAAKWNAALTSFIDVLLPLRAVTMSQQDLRCSTAGCTAGILPSNSNHDADWFICQVSPSILASLPSALLFYTLFRTLLGAAMKPCPTRTRTRTRARATARWICCFGFSFFLGGLAVRRCLFFFYAYTSSLSSCL